MNCSGTEPDQFRNYSIIKKLFTLSHCKEVYQAHSYTYCTLVTSQNQITVANFAQDTAILTLGNNSEECTGKLQTTINQIQKWTKKKWHIQLNESKSVHINFTNRRLEHIQVTINNQKLPYANTAKYLGMTLDYLCMTLDG